MLDIGLALRHLVSAPTYLDTSGNYNNGVISNTTAAGVLSGLTGNTGWFNLKNTGFIPRNSRVALEFFMPGVITTVTATAVTIAFTVDYADTSGGTVQSTHVLKPITVAVASNLSGPIGQAYAELAPSPHPWIRVSWTITLTGGGSVSVYPNLGIYIVGNPESSSTLGSVKNIG